MLMSALEAGGLKVHDNPGRDRHNLTDGSYRVSHGGLREPSRQEMRQPGWPRQHDDCAIKLVAPFLGQLAVHDYRVVMMLRDPEEIRQSCEAAFGWRTSPDLIRAVQEEAVRTLENRRDVRDVRVLQYRDVICDPQGALASLKWPIDAAAAASVVDDRQYRFRRERLVVGL